LLQNPKTPKRVTQINFSKNHNFNGPDDSLVDRNVGSLVFFTSELVLLSQTLF